VDPQLRRELRAVLDSLWDNDRDLLTVAGRDKLGAARRLVDLDEYESNRARESLGAALTDLRTDLAALADRLLRRVTRRP
jgi:hypothetical protein